MVYGVTTVWTIEKFLNFFLKNSNSSECNLLPKLSGVGNFVHFVILA